jgi:hypothetical protein
VGPCLTDAAPKDRSQRTARILTAMMPPERMRRQSSRLSWPGGSIRTSMTTTATTQILAQWRCLSREQMVVGSMRATAGKVTHPRRGCTSLDLQLEQFDQLRPTRPLLLRESGEFVETHALNVNAYLFHPLDKGVARQQGVKLCA